MFQDDEYQELEVSSYAGESADGSWSLIVTFKGLDDQDDAESLSDMIQYMLGDTGQTVH